MKIVVVSDTHGHPELLVAALRHIGKSDMLLHLGDGQRDCDALDGLYHGEIRRVKGNCDFAADEKLEDFLPLAGASIYMTHGHLFEVKSSLNRLWFKGREVGADIVCFGHTHVPQLEKQGDVTLLNPGSLKSAHTVGLIELKDGKADVRIVSIPR